MAYKYWKFWGKLDIELYKNVKKEHTMMFTDYFSTSIVQ